MSHVYFINGLPSSEAVRRAWFRGIGRLFLVQRSGSLMRAWGDTRLTHGAALLPRHYSHLGPLLGQHWSFVDCSFQQWSCVPQSNIRDEIGVVDHCRVQRFPLTWLWLRLCCASATHQSITIISLITLITPHTVVL